MCMALLFFSTREDANSSDFNIRVVADISCDIDGPVASTFRPSTIKILFMVIILLLKKKMNLLMMG